MRRHRNAKIIATLGPASSSEETIRDLFLAGADVFRLNFSHGSVEEHRERLQVIRRLERQIRRPVAAVLDLQGPKLRIGQFGKGSAHLEGGKTFRLDLDESPGDAQRVHLPHGEGVCRTSPGAGPVAGRREGSAGGQGLGGELRRNDGEDRRSAVEQQGRQRARRGAALVPLHGKGQERPATRPRSRRRLGGGLLHSAPAGSGGAAPGTSAGAPRS